MSAASRVVIVLLPGCYHSLNTMRTSSTVIVCVRVSTTTGVTMCAPVPPNVIDWELVVSVVSATSRVTAPVVRPLAVYVMDLPVAIISEAEVIPMSPLNAMSTTSKSVTVSRSFATRSVPSAVKIRVSEVPAPPVRVSGS